MDGGFAGEDRPGSPRVVDATLRSDSRYEALGIRAIRRSPRLTAGANDRPARRPILTSWSSTRDIATTLTRKEDDSERGRRQAQPARSTARKIP